MDGSLQGKGIDAQTIRDHGADVRALAREIRDIEREALALQKHLSEVRPMPTARKDRRRWRHGG